jgi:hypothetical protein
MMQSTIEAPPIGGLWVLLVQNDGELATQDNDGRVPVMCRAGNDQTYLLVFKNVAKARQFVAASACRLRPDDAAVRRFRRTRVI